MGSSPATQSIISVVTLRKRWPQLSQRQMETM
jgi:hypothetical protein